LQNRRPAKSLPATNERIATVNIRVPSALTFGILTAAIFVAGTGLAQAQTTANLAVTATVIPRCIISAAPLAFSNYDPLVDHETTPRDATGSVTIRCTKGSNPTVALDLGLTPAGSTRRMSNGGTEFLNYELYKEAARTNVWGASGGAVVNPGASTSLAPRTLTVFGRIAAAQDVATGNYSDTVVATVTF
jgi:spore coat protein U-like protein